MEEADLILGYYRAIAEDWLAVPVLVGKKSPAETFPGAVYTLTVEGLMKDGLALQMGTSHYFGQNFARAYDISFSNKENERELCYSTSWGMSTRLVGALVMAHGDDSGLIVPPKVAPTQVIVVPIFRDDAGRAKVERFIETWAPELKAAGVRYRVDWRDERPGDKYAHWELKGVPIRLNVGVASADVEADRHALQLPVRVLVARALVAPVDAISDARGFELGRPRLDEALDLDAAVVVPKNRHHDHLGGRHFGRHDQARIVTVRHHQRADQAGAH